MNRKAGTYIILGLVIGAMLGLGMSAASGNAIWGVGLGSLFGVFIGWFVAAAVQENANRKNTGR